VELTDAKKKLFHLTSLFQKLLKGGNISIERQYSYLVSENSLVKILYLDLLKKSINIENFY